MRLFAMHMILVQMIVVSLSLRFLSFFFRSLKFGSQQIKMIDAYIFHESNYVLMNAMFCVFLLGEMQRHIRIREVVVDFCHGKDETISFADIARI